MKKIKIEQYNNNWIPVSENGDSNVVFDERFTIDRTFNVNSLFYKYRIRFVQYPDCEKNSVQVFLFRMFKMPKFYWKYVEKTMNPPFFHNWLFRSEEIKMTLEQVYDTFKYEIKL